MTQYNLRRPIELFFKELKSTLGLDPYRFRDFVTVERWVAVCLPTFESSATSKSASEGRLGISKKLVLPDFPKFWEIRPRETPQSFVSTPPYQRASTPTRAPWKNTSPCTSASVSVKKLDVGTCSLARATPSSHRSW